MSRLQNSGRYDSLDAVSLPTLSDFPWAAPCSPPPPIVRYKQHSRVTLFMFEFETSLRCDVILS